MSSPRRRTLLTAAAAGVVGALATGCEESTHRFGARRPRDRFVSGSFRSHRMRDAKVGWSIAYPPGHRDGDRLPVVVTLHARSASHRTPFTTLGLDAVLDRLVRDRTSPPFAVASVDGGDHSYYHRRADGTDAGAMVVDEFVPLLHERGLGTHGLALHGWSMGGYGALLLAGARRLPVRAVAVASPALFSSSGRTPPGAFDDARDYLRNDVYSHPGRLAGIPVRIDCGTSDPFYLATLDFVDRMRPRPVTSFGHGGHDAAYWRSVAPAELAFLGAHLRAA